MYSDLKKRNSHISTSATPTSRAAPAKSLTFLWGATGEQEWTPALTTGKTYSFRIKIFKTTEKKEFIN